ncbi:PPM-type phosphatase domain-containing protein [Meloidogyne graminicola]|uniref:PPM-type phosphatase domain-containing protein n=1 Tax=Meloidogyne graminicola TaxID=189291 RepID=A0A8S9ZZL6_9BILA|nr:PPM-type phosphatase domain-containing protein [Meloidogyne graminicola]
MQKSVANTHFFHSRAAQQRRNLATAKATVDQILRANERTILFSGDEQQAIARIDVGQVSANKPIEDFYSASKCLNSNAFLLGVFDGHGGAKSNCPLTTVRDTLQSSFSALDEDLVKSAMPDQNGLVCRMSVNVAVSGSCALIAHIRKNNLHVASCGDSAAVLGVHLSNDVIARQLTRPHTVENFDEIARIRSAHPPSENRTILKANRLLGELYPLRAFGDVRFKWAKELQKIVLEPLGMPAPQNLLTPPYLTCLPEVFYHQLTSNDRLWEFLDSDAVVRLVEDHMTGHSTLNIFRPEHRQSLGDILNNLERRQTSDNKKPLDENCATHLIRNALGGVSGDVELQYARLEEMLMLPPGMARHYRDDITVIVIQFNERYLLEDHEDDGGHS